MKDLLLIMTAIVLLVLGVNAVAHGYVESSEMLKYLGGALLGAFVSLVCGSK